MSNGKLKSSAALSPADERFLAQRAQFEALCSWIDSHLDGPLGWQELMEQSGWDYEIIDVPPWTPPASLNTNQLPV